MGGIQTVRTPATLAEVLRADPETVADACRSRPWEAFSAVSEQALKGIVKRVGPRVKGRTDEHTALARKLRKNATSKLALRVRIIRRSPYNSLMGRLAHRGCDCADRAVLPVELSSRAEWGSHSRRVESASDVFR